MDVDKKLLKTNTCAKIGLKILEGRQALRETVSLTAAPRNGLLKFRRIDGGRVTPRSNIIIKIAEVWIGR